MKKINDSFFEYAMGQSKDPTFLQWLKGIAEKYSKRLACPLCGDEKVDVIITPKAFVRCEACNTRNEISIDKLQPGDYNAVTFLHEEKIKAILEAKE